jgi:TonB family protein
MMRRLFFVSLVAVVSWNPAGAQSVSPTPNVPLPQAVFTPRPIYRPEWAKQGLTGKGVVLVTIDKETGKVTGAKMFESTGNQLLDGAALQAYSQWRFKPGSSVSQLKMPIEFSNRPPPGQAPRNKISQPRILYPVLILVGLGVIMALFRQNGSR